MLKILDKFGPYFVIGIQNTIFLAACSLFFGLILGMLLGMAKMSRFKLVKIPSTIYVEFVRGVPLLTQIYIIYFGSFVAFGVDLSAFYAGVIAISLNSAAYVAEIIRSGIQAVDKGQTEAGRSLGISSALTMRHIVLPQAIKNILPALGNEFVTLLKETSVVSTIGVYELTFQTNIVKASSFDAINPLIISALIYFFLTFTISRALGIMERRLKKSD